MLTSIRSRIRASILYLFVFASIALLSACSGGNNNGGSSPGAPVIANAQPLAGSINSAYSFTFTVSSGGQAPFTWSETGALPDGLMLASNGILSGTPTASGSFPITVKVEDSASQTATKDVNIQINSTSTFTFTFTGTMATPRIFHTATLLSSGQVVVVGGKDNNGNAVESAETYEPGPGTFTPALTTLNQARFSHTATLLDAFTILIAGGTGLAGTSLSSAEIYDSETGSFMNTAGPMTIARSQHTDTMLSDGTVLLAGGVDAFGNALDSAEIYNPATGTFTATGHMTIARVQHTATMLDDGTVLFTGGVDATGVTTATAEIYDPATHTFTATASMSDSRAQHLATAIGLGAVLVAGGYSNDGQTVTTLASGQSYNGTFTPLLTDMIEPRAQTTITSLSGSGLFILTGGAKFVLANCGNSCVTFVPQSLATTEGFSNFDLDFFPEPSMNTARRGHTATLLADGSTVLIVGGANSTLGARSQLVDTVLSSAELFH
jgi:Galactose oxidase, central domain